MLLKNTEQKDLLNYVRTVKGGHKYGSTPDLIEDIVLFILNRHTGTEYKLISKATIIELFKPAKKKNVWSDEVYAIEKKWVDLITPVNRKSHYAARWKNLTAIKKGISLFGYDNLLRAVSFIAQSEFWRKATLDSSFSFVVRNYPKINAQILDKISKERSDVTKYLLSDGTLTEDPSMFPDLTIVKTIN